MGYESARLSPETNHSIGKVIKMAKRITVAVMGYGVVGSGVCSILADRQEKNSAYAGCDVRLKRILDIRDYPDSLFINLFTKNFDDILEDPEINVVAECIGGTGVAYKFTKALLEKGKSVVTSNKAMVAAHGCEMLEIAKSNGCHYIFEAAVGGGIPIIRTLRNSYACEDIKEIFGILNGTTNYMLTKMRSEGTDYSEALEDARKRGYAEADPTDDVEGYDACRKIAILASLAWNRFVDYRDIAVTGISKVTAADIAIAGATGNVIKLVGRCRMDNGKLYAMVSPVMVREDNPLAGVSESYNSILVNSDNLDNCMFYGRGAGRLPTASAVVSDIVDIASGLRPIYYDWNQDNVAKVEEGDEFYSEFFIYVESDDIAAAEASVKELLRSKVQQTEIKDATLGAKAVAFTTGKMRYRDLKVSLDLLADMPGKGKVRLCMPAVL